MARALADKCHNITLPQAVEATAAIFEIMADALAEGHAITARGFATITPVTRAARKCRDIKGGRTIDLPAQIGVKITLSDALKKRLNP